MAKTEQTDKIGKKCKPPCPLDESILGKNKGVPDIQVSIDVPKKRAIDCLLRTAIDNDHLRHQANVCVICDEVIIGTEEVCSIEKEQILKHSDRLSVRSYNEFYGRNMHPELERQYQIHDMKGLLLSPRSR